MTKTVVAPGAARTTETNLTEGQTQIIRDHQNTIVLYFLGLHPITHSLTRQIHEGLRFDQHKLFARLPTVANRRVAPAGKIIGRAQLLS